MKCLAIACSHNSKSHKCKFYRFPVYWKPQRKVWIQIARRRPTTDTHRLCSCHFKDGNKENEPTLEITEESCCTEEVYFPEKSVIQEQICSPSFVDRRDHSTLSTTVNIDSDVPLTCAENDYFLQSVNSETVSSKLSDSSLNDSQSLSIYQRLLLTEEENDYSSFGDTPITSTLIRIVPAHSDQSYFFKSVSEYTTGNLIDDDSIGSTNKSVSELRLLKNLMKKVDEEKERIKMERKSFAAAESLWKKEKETLLREKAVLLQERNRSLAENLLLKEELEIVRVHQKKDNLVGNVKPRKNK